jgi:hypothetical protein
MTAGLSLLAQRLDIGCDILRRGAAERQLRHFRVRIEQEICKPLGVEIRRSGDGRKGRRIGTRTRLIGRDHMAGSAPSLGEIAAMLGVGRTASYGTKDESG